jgi:hypothetical protein
VAIFPKAEKSALSSQLDEFQAAGFRPLLGSHIDRAAALIASVFATTELLRVAYSDSAELTAKGRDSHLDNLNSSIVSAAMEGLAQQSALALFFIERHEMGEDA